MSPRKNKTLSRRDFLKATGVMAGSVLLSACSEYIQEIPTPTLTVSPTATKTLTPTPTQTPEPTATLSPTATDVPRIDFQIVYEGDTPKILKDGTILFNFETPYDQLLTDEMLAVQLGGVEPISKPFFTNLTRYFDQVDVGGHRIYKRFDPKTVMIPEWDDRYIRANNSNTISLYNSQACEAMSFPIRPFFAFTSPKLGVFVVGQNIYYPANESTVTRWMAFDQPMNGILKKFQFSGAYSAFVYGFDFTVSNPGNQYVTAQKLHSATFSDGSSVYPSSLADEGYQRLLMYDPLLDNIPLIGVNGRGLVKDDY